MRLNVDEVSVAYGRRRALRAVTLDIGVGVTALFGANGAGKSTLLEVLANVRAPQAGRVEMLGVGELGPRSGRVTAYRRAVAWLPQSFTAFPRLNVREHVAYSGWLKGMAKSDAWNSAAEAIDQVGLSELAERKVRQLSGGQQRRVGIAGALVHNAQVILLDEPSAGLDPVQRERLKDVLLQVGKQRVVLVSSHDTDGAENLFDNAVVLRSGSVTFHGSLNDFLASEAQDSDPQKRLTAAYLRWAGSDDV